MMVYASSKCTDVAPYSTPVSSLLSPIQHNVPAVLTWLASSHPWYTNNTLYWKFHPALVLLSATGIALGFGPLSRASCLAFFWLRLVSVLQTQYQYNNHEYLYCVLALLFGLYDGHDPWLSFLGQAVLEAAGAEAVRTEAAGTEAVAVSTAGLKAVVTTVTTPLSPPPPQPSHATNSPSPSPSPRPSRRKQRARPLPSSAPASGPTSAPTPIASNNHHLPTTLSPWPTLVLFLSGTLYMSLSNAGKPPCHTIPYHIPIAVHSLLQFLMLRLWTAPHMLLLYSNP